MTFFQYSPKIVETFPQVVGGVIIADRMINGETPERLKQEYLEEQAKVKARIGETPLSEIESLSAWRRAFATFGVSPTKYRNAAEALTRRLTKKGDIPSINTLVDIGNLVSIRYGLPVAIFDRREVAGAVTVDFSDGTETYTELGNEAVIHPEVGEVVFSDTNKMVIARRWCWRQSASSAARPDTSSAIVTVEAQHPSGRDDIEHALNDLMVLLTEFAGGQFRSAILDRENRSI